MRPGKIVIRKGTVHHLIVVANNRPSLAACDHYGRIQQRVDDEGDSVPGMSVAWSVPGVDQVWRPKKGKGWGFKRANLTPQIRYIRLEGKPSVTRTNTPSSVRPTQVGERDALCKSSTLARSRWPCTPGRNQAVSSFMILHDSVYCHSGDLPSVSIERAFQQAMGSTGI
jgi:hypothetical protein